MRFKRAVGTLAMCVGLGAVASACTITPYAAKVNGDVISVSALNNELEQMAANKAFVTNIQQSSTGGKVFGQGAGTFNSAFTAKVLNRRVSLVLASQLLAKVGHAPLQSDLAVALPEAQASFGGAAVFAKFPKSYQLQAIKDTADIQLLEASLEHKSISANTLRTIYNQDPQQFAQICSSQILVGSQALAEAAAAQVNAGVSFASVAKAQSKDPNSAANGGAVGCGLLSDYSKVLGKPYAQAIVNLPTGVLSAPFKGANGWAIVEVTSRNIPSFGQAIPELVNAQLGTQGNTILATAISQALKSSKIEVNPAYGSLRLVSGQLGIVPPAPPSAKSLTFFKAP